MGLLLCTIIIFILIFILVWYLILNYQVLYHLFYGGILDNTKKAINHISPLLSDSMIRSYIQKLNLGLLGGLVLLLNQGGIIGPLDFIDIFRFGIVLFITFSIFLSSNFVFNLVKLVFILPDFLCNECQITKKETTTGHWLGRIV